MGSQTATSETRITKHGGKIIPAEQAKDIRYRVAHFQNWLRAQTNSYSTDLERPTNDELSALECFDTLTEPPSRLFAYVQWINNAQSPRCGETEPGCIIKTFTGDLLGRVVYAGRPYRSNFGDERQSIRVQLADDAGTMYHGTFYSGAGDYCRLSKYSD